MGIPRLLHRLRDSGHVQVETFKADDGRQKTAIIDGPSLAHFVARTLNFPDLKSSHVGSASVYKACNDAVVVWLDHVQSAGFVVEGIFFDGALPQSKKAVRLGRLTAYAQALESYKNVYDAVSRTTGVRSEEGPDVWVGNGIRTARRNLAPHPFLVPAVVETLLQSKYSEKVYVVPGEADTFCVAATRRISTEDDERPAFIFTSDSDLAVFDSGINTKIVYFHSLDLRMYSGETTVTGETISASQISQALKVPNLLFMAYLLEEDPHLPVKTALDKIKKGTHFNTRSYHNFVTNYTTTKEASLLETLQQNPRHRSRLNNLDARLSEVIHQIETSPSEPPTSYLPFLLENPSRSTAYNISLHLRQASYTLLLNHNRANHPENKQSLSDSVTEYKRSTNRIVPTTISLLDDDSLISALRSLLVTLSSNDLRLRPSSATTTAANQKLEGPHWRLIILNILLHSMAEQEMKLPASLSDADLVSLIVRGVRTGDANESAAMLRNWETAHFFAMFQAIYYSLRMVWQAVGCLTAREEAEAGEDVEAEGLWRLVEAVKGALEDMPTIAEFFEESSYASAAGEGNTWTDAVKGLIEGLQKETGFVLREGDADGSSGGGKRKRKKKNKGDEQAEKKRKGADQAALPTNPFALLAGDMDED